MRLRLHGTRAEVAEATRRLLRALEVVAVSPPYPDRGASVPVQVYFEVRLPEATESTTAAPCAFSGPIQGSGPAAARGGGGR